MWRATVLVLFLLAACSSPANRDPGAERTEAAPSADGHETRSEYTSSVRPIGPQLRDRMRYSHGSGCPVQLEDLRYLRMSYVAFDGREHLGEMVVHKHFADDVVAVFGQLYDARWPIQRMRLVDDYQGDDDLSMAANNTSAYNCRRVAGTDRWSNHAYGAAIDVNPVQNPYVTATSTVPPAGRKFATIDRSPTATVPAGTIRVGDVVVRAFARIGWGWGGQWSASKDYQHFSATSR